MKTEKEILDRLDSIVEAKKKRDQEDHEKGVKLFRALIDHIESEGLEAEDLGNGCLLVKIP